MKTQAWNDFSQVLRVLAHPARLGIVEELLRGERDVNTLRAALGVEGSSVSQHLATLRAHRLVEQRRAGQRIFYRLTSSRLGDWLLAGSSLASTPPAPHDSDGRFRYEVVQQTPR